MSSQCFVIRHLGILAQTSNYQKFIKKTNKIPDYAREYRNEYLFIRGIDTCFKFFWDNTCKADKGIFQNNRVEIIKKKINKLDQAQRLGYLNDISNMEIDEQDVFYSSSLLEELNDFTDYYVDDDWEFDQERFDRFVDRDFPGYKNLVECIELFHSKFKMVFDKNKIKIIWPDSDSDSDDDGVDSDDIKDILNGCEDSESDSDSD